MRRLVPLMLCTLLVGPVFAQPQAPTPRPKSLVAALGGRLAVLGSADGRASYVPGQFRDVSSIAVTPDGRSIMVGPRDCEKNWIEQINIATGAVENDLVGASDFPVVNAKNPVMFSVGRVVASQNAKGIVAYGVRCDGHSLGFTDILTGQNARRGPFGELSIQTEVELVRPLAWLSDGRTLFYEVTVPGEAHPRYYFGRVWPLVSADEEVVTRVGAALHATGLDPTAAALVNDKTVAFAQDDSSGARVREWDISTESFLGADRSFHLAETITALTADPSGTHFLVVTARHALYRWSVGDVAPTKLADDVSAAAWLP